MNYMNRMLTFMMSRSIRYIILKGSLISSRTILLLIAITMLVSTVACGGSADLETSGVSHRMSDEDGGSSVARVAVVDDLSGSVTAMVDSGEVAAFRGLAMRRRDEISTANQSWTCLELDEGQFVLIEENSDVLISRLSDDMKNVEISLATGKIWVWISEGLGSGESFEVTTPSCSLSVRGTFFSVSCDIDANVTIAVFEGETRVSTDDESFDMSAGNAADITVENGIVSNVRIYEITINNVSPFSSGNLSDNEIFEKLRLIMEHIPLLAQMHTDVVDPTEASVAWTQVTSSLGLPSSRMMIYDIPGLSPSVITMFTEGPVSYEEGLELWRQGGIRSNWLYQNIGTDSELAGAFRVDAEDTTGDYHYMVNLEGEVDGVEFSDDALMRLWGFSYGFTTIDQLEIVFPDGAIEDLYGMIYYSMRFDGYGHLSFRIDTSSCLTEFSGMYWW